MPERRKPGQVRRRWLDWEVEFLRREYSHYATEILAAVLGRGARNVHAKANELGLHKTPELLSELARDRSSAVDHGGRRSRFQPGLVPWNKGLSYTAGGRSPDNRFKPGMKPHTTLPLGSLRIVEGVLERKFSEEPGPPGKRWRAVTRLVWEAAHGPIPEGHVVAFRAGMTTTKESEITLDRIELISRMELMRRNSIHQMPEELRSLTRLRGVLQKAINRRARNEAREEADGVCTS